jgi:hypothetical protein
MADFPRFDQGLGFLGNLAALLRQVPQFQGGGLQFPPPPQPPRPPPQPPAAPTPARPRPRPPGAPVRGGGPGRGPPVAAPYYAPPPPDFYAPGWDKFIACATKAGKASVRRGKSTDQEIADAIYQACGPRPPGLIPAEFDDFVIPKVPSSPQPSRALLGPILQRALPFILRQVLPRIGAPMVIPAPEPAPELEPAPRGPTKRPRITRPTDVPELFEIPIEWPRRIPPDFFPAPTRPTVFPHGPQTRPKVRPRPRPVGLPLPAPTPQPVPAPRRTPAPLPTPRLSPFLLPLALPFLPLAFPHGSPLHFAPPGGEPTPQPRPPTTPRPGRPRPGPLTPNLPGMTPFSQPLGFRNPADPCQCTDTKPKRKPRKPRTECRAGTYTETRRGTLKRPQRRIPCR